MIPFRMGPLEVILILVVILIVFGVGKLPQVGGAIGKGIHAFKKGQQDEDAGEAEIKSRQLKKATRKKTAES